MPSRKRRPSGRDRHNSHNKQCSKQRPSFGLPLGERGKQVLGCILLGAALLWYIPQAGQPDYWLSLDNGDGGTGWVIGEVKIARAELGKQRTLPELQSYALQLVNRDRQINGLASLTEDPLLSLAAQRHAEDMLTRQFYDHINPDGQDPSDRFRAVGGQQGAGENISQWKGGPYAHASYGLSEELQQGWMYSDGHRQNLLKPDYKTFGYGIVASRNGREIYAVQLFSY